MSRISVLMARQDDDELKCRKPVSEEGNLNESLNNVAMIDIYIS